MLEVYPGASALNSPLLHFLVTKGAVHSGTSWDLLISNVVQGI
jgi:hypothetical protein